MKGIGPGLMSSRRNRERRIRPTEVDNGGNSMKLATKRKLHLRQRTIRPSTRRPDSPYRVKVEDASSDDLVVIFIDHESMDFREIYHCRGSAFHNGSSSVTFRWNNNQVVWAGEIVPE